MQWDSEVHELNNLTQTKPKTKTKTNKNQPTKTQSHPQKEIFRNCGVEETGGLPS